MPNPGQSPATPRPDFMVALGLLPPISKDDVEQAYRQLALKAHPDHGGHIDDFRTLQSAYERAKEHIEFQTDKRQWIAARIENQKTTDLDSYKLLNSKPKSILFLKKAESNLLFF